MAKYRKKPVVIDAVLWTGENADEIRSFTGNGAISIQYLDEPPTLHVHTLEGAMKANAGDYIIKGVKGEFYPCKPDIFEATYEKVD